MNLDPKFILPIMIATLVGCAADQEVKTEPSLVKLPASHSPTQILEEKAILADEFEVSLVSVDGASTSSERMPSPALAGKHKMAKQAQELAYIQAPNGRAQLVAQQALAPDFPVYYSPETDREQYAPITPSAVKQVSSDPVSTFSIDVDTGSYSNIRRMLNHGSRPPVDAVRIEEMINYFDYAYVAPDTQDQPFSIQTELAISPWSEEHALLRIGLKGYEPEAEKRPASNLVFLLDVSGSMNAPDKLPLLKKSLLLLSQQLSAEDSVAIVVYAGASGVVLEPTTGNQSLKIEQALESLSAGGSTNGQAGIHLAYQLARQAYKPAGINRVILATDGDFNVGIRDVEALKKLIEQKREQGISLTTLGFGTGNYNDHLMEQLANVGNGNYAYIDSFNEARKVLVEELTSTLMTIARDVKIQVEFNSTVVKEYRLLGYENRVLAREDFNNDKVDAGEIGAGHTVTALYELVLQGSEGQRIDPLRYQDASRANPEPTDPLNNELAFIKLRYKALNASDSTLISRPVLLPEHISAFEEASDDFRFSATVAAFGENLRQSHYVSGLDYDRLIEHALQAKGADPFGYRSEFIQLLRLAAKL